MRDRQAQAPAIRSSPWGLPLIPALDPLTSGNGHRDSLAGNENITQEEAYEYRLWDETRPSFAPPSGFGFRGGDGFFRSFGKDTVIEEFEGLSHGRALGR
jgi:hypothetical protein